MRAFTRAKVISPQREVSYPAVMVSAMTTPRKKISSPTEAALWALSNGRCYFPGCTEPVVKQVKPGGAYRKNAQIAHIHGVAPGAPRFKPMPEGDRDSFGNLLLLCYPHHREIDDEKTGEQSYPAGELRRWKDEHEGANRGLLAAMGPVDEDDLEQRLLKVFEPPLDRLRDIADQLELTGSVNAQTVQELRDVIGVIGNAPSPIDRRTAAILEEATEVFGGRFHHFVERLEEIAPKISARRMEESTEMLRRVAERIEEAARRMQSMY